MNPKTFLQRALDSRQRTLNENESKRILEHYGIPTVDERVASDADSAVAAADELGYPVVVKGLGAVLAHKSEQGLVHLGLNSADAVRAAVKTVAAAADGLEGFLVQTQIDANRELVAGMFRDRQFGPVVMFGLGGVFTEALSDVTFRLAPLSEADAEEMISDTRASALLGKFRGQAPADRRALIQVLTGLSRLALDHPQIAEIDVNPLLVSPDGRVCAVDALVAVAPPVIDGPYPRAVGAAAIRPLFYPASIAFVGASSEMGKWGHMLMCNTVSGGYQGEVYLINPRGGTIAGRPVYKSVVDVPGNIDLGVVTIPAAKVSALIPQFEKKGIRNMLLITSGFAETGAQGRRLETQLVDAARQAGVLILGPNTMGICNPHASLNCTSLPVHPRAGGTTVIAQSGNMGTQLLAFSESQGIGIRGFCGSGNEAMMTIEDYLDGLEQDPITKTVMLYIESVKNGRRFFESAQRLGRKKPIVLLKGGRSRAGNQAAASHTGALSSDTRVFDAVCRQAGIVQVEQPMDLLDLTAAFSSLPLPPGNRVAVMTLGGGWGVVTADLCSDYGISLPALSADIIARIDTILPPYWSRANPVDLVGERDHTIPMTVIEELLKWDGCDAVINLGILGRRIFVRRLAESIRVADPDYSPEFLEAAKKFISDFEKTYTAHIARLMEIHQKPVFGVSLVTDAEDRTVYGVAGCRYKAVFYPTPERAVRALAKMHAYRQFLDR